MAQYTRTACSAWIAPGPRGWGLLVLVLSLLVTLGGATQTQPWVEWVPWHERDPIWLGLRPSRVGRWWAQTADLIGASAGCLAGRLGLMLGLIAASGLAQSGRDVWPLAGLPVVDWGLHVVGRRWPGLLARPAYRAGRASVHRLYQASVLALGGLNLIHGSTQVWAGAGRLGGVIVCERDGSRVTLEAQPGGASCGKKRWPRSSGSTQRTSACGNATPPRVSGRSCLVGRRSAC